MLKLYINDVNLAYLERFQLFSVEKVGHGFAWTDGPGQKAWKNMVDPENNRYG